MSTRQLERPSAAALPGRGVWPLRDHPTTLWLTAALVVAALGRGIPAADWLVVHLVLLGAVTHAVMVWSTHFAQALLKTPPTLDGRRQQGRRLALLLVGSTLVFVGVPAGWWPVTVAGATCAAAAVTWHGVQLWRRLRAALPGRFRITIRYYLAAATAMPVGAFFGVLLARQPADPWHARLVVAHSMTMALGWLGLTVTGTLVTFWPTLLRARMDDRAEALARQALPVLVIGVTIAVGGALAGWHPLTSLGLMTYAAGLLWWARALISPARRSVPRRFATVSAACALTWFVAAVVAVAVLVLVTPDWTEVGAHYDLVAAALAVGFALQLVLAALSHLVPSVLGGGPAVLRAGLDWFERGAPFRVVVLNLGLALWLLPLPSPTRMALGGLVALAVASFLPLTGLAVRESVRARRAAQTVAGATVPVNERAFWTSGQLAAAVSVIALVVAASLALPSAAAGGGRTEVTPTGHTTTVEVTARDMRFTPASITVPLGDRLVIRLTNRDETTTHDLVLDTGGRTARLAPGATGELDAGVVAGPVEGWCSVVGHRQMGMVLHVLVAGGGAAGTAAPLSRAGSVAGSVPSAGHDGSAMTVPDATVHAGQGVLGAGFTAYDPVLPPLGAERVHRVTLTVEELEQQVAPGVWQRRWTYNGTSPGPTLHGRVGDVFEVTLVNHGTMGHSIDFHAGSRAPDAVMRTVPPGARLTYRFTASRAGIWMYHCSTMPMSAHIAAGLFGAVVIEPPDLPAVDRSFLLVQSELYLGASTTHGSAGEVDATKAQADTPDGVVFNGTAFQYDTTQLRARVGERVRFWVLDAGPNRPSSFHVVGAQFDAVWAEGAWLLRRDGSSGGSQTLSLGAAQGGFVETSFPEAGHYPFVSHVMADAERGAHGIVLVQP
ncbi:multicopper oxidase domain-containing protein [Humibacillus xanthopallidus]|uniref:Copper-containing nitrite reductase n=1 Tax=Humibacillus xanthopallidus TaxID=412689 RepID=A0A543HA59_9MICO|nr:multicopper oxidase domain-containing protein [Humibacillus xanthopallidus]TQM55224.1 nitrite reductase (NO-forming) [Humibacillus xanthopallidus]